ncbi:MAG: alginate O-acetyltransferase AlgX-related protein [Methylocystis sp.]|uniref:alginate O-acetyltransferase AlgX-related protein n=1 Tax=Methylocystis sp. TaxID=1911079 RepID=UPI003DA4606F
MRARFLQRLPIFGCAGFLGVMLLINLWNAAVSADWPKLRIRSAEPLWGVSAPKPAPWSLDALLSGETQKAVSTRIGQTQPVFPISVRIKNQFLYSVFGASGAPDIFIGRERTLFEKFYIEEFCARGAPPDPVAVDAWAMRLRAIQTAVEAQSKRFVYLISPSKAARDSGLLPPHVSCPARALHSDKLAPYRAALDAHGIAYVDGASLMTEKARDYPIGLFPRGGTHWNYLGAALAARDLTRRVNAHGPSALPDYDFDWRPREEARGTDIDLLRLLNLLWPDRRYPTAEISGRSIGACDRRPMIFAAGGSFTIEPLIDLIESSCRATADFWHYVRHDPGKFSRSRHSVDSREAFEQEGDPNLETDADFAKAFARADIVLLEENEAVIAEMKQVDDLLAAATK